MSFASFEFLFVFLPVVLTCYFAAPDRLRNTILLVASYLYYAWLKPDFAVILAAVTTFTYAAARVMAASGRRQGLILITALAGNLLLLGYFKYANFGMATWNDLWRPFGYGAVAWTAVALPIGLSFYVLQSVSYLVDVRRGTVPVSRSLRDYAMYKAFFPQLINGPIVRYSDIIGDLDHRRLSLRQFSNGARTFMVGFAMKTVVADTLGPMVDAAFALPRPAFLDSWIGTAGFTLQLYFDFAGYSLMAIGLARAMGFHFPANFNHPYLATSMQEYWQRWHMTLSRFLRDYLYIPLGGNRHGRARTGFNLLAVLTIGGLWHGASWNFIVWGFGHGMVLAVGRWANWGEPRRVAPRSGALTRAGRFARGNLGMLAVVLAGRVVFRADTLAGAGAVYAGMAGAHGWGMSDDFAWQATPDRLWMLLIAVAIVYAPLLDGRLVIRAAAALRPIWPSLGFALGIVLLYSRSAVPFIYFRF